ncbi:hypothetical protein GALMADRAFT_212991 [Galerina marginata CBS 339.88]|uniref:Protein LCHN n=1 Tax=Galerina marginata (strain CBS 339.88) TaxID=685588 RepID=A0A067SQ22_GALM3|nr:hypothetical protein GALMADRAFT_212991 [Galerina marginata CBS 339.88]
MSESEPRARYPQDIVAIFHASFHPTKGNIVDWSLKASDDLNLEHLEFSALPSGLHLVEQDVVYFTKDNQQGVCVFRRRTTTEQGHRGYRLSSLGILLAKSRRPRPAQHVRALKDLIDSIYALSEGRGVLEPTESDWEPARAFFEDRKLRRSDLGGAGDWAGWSEELDGAYSEPSNSNPTLHLPHLLRILGPSSLTLYKHVFGRKRILIYTLPPVEVACILCHVAGDLSFESQAGSSSNEIGTGRLKGKHKEPINVLGMVTLVDLDRLEAESKTGRGWIACTTDAIFMEKPSYYDLLIDLTTSTPNKTTRPTFYASKPVPSQPGSSRAPPHRLSTIRFAWSDVRLWNEIDRILQLDSTTSHASCCGPPSENPTKSKSITAWTDAWQVYEDVCIICAGLWMGMGSWRGNSTASYSTAGGVENWGAVRLEGDDDLTVDGAYVRSVGMGIEGRPVPAESLTPGVGGSTSTTMTPKAARRASAMSWSSGKATVVGSSVAGGKARQASSSTVTPSRSGPLASEGGDNYDLNQYQYQDADLAQEQELQRRNGQVLTTMAILQTFHAHTSFQLSVLEDILIKQGLLSPSTSTSGSASRNDQAREKVVSLSAKDILAFELGPLSALDARYLEWLVQEYAGDEVRVVMRRGWRDLVAAVFGYG